MVTGQKSVFNGTTHNLHQALVKHCQDKNKVEFLEVGGVANILEEKVSAYMYSEWDSVQELGTPKELSKTVLNSKVVFTYFSRSFLCTK